MLERFLNAAIDGKMVAHLNSVDYGSSNRRNGKISKLTTILLYNGEGNRSIFFVNIKRILYEKV